MEIFDWKYYIDNNNDLLLNGINNKEKAIEHWNNHGKYENRKHNFINNINYNNEDVWNILKKLDNKEIDILYKKNNYLFSIFNIEYFDWKFYIESNYDLIDKIKTKE